MKKLSISIAFLLLYIAANAQYEVHSTYIGRSKIYDPDKGIGSIQTITPSTLTIGEDHRLESIQDQGEIWTVYWTTEDKSPIWRKHDRDEFERKLPMGYRLGEYTVERVPHSKEFLDQESATFFYNEALNQSGVFMVVLTSNSPKVNNYYELKSIPIYHTGTLTGTK